MSVGFEVNPGVSTVAVRATGPGGAAASLYFDQACTVPATQPITITEPTNFWVVNSGTYQVSMQIGGVEFGTPNGTPATVPLPPGAFPTIAPTKVENSIGYPAVALQGTPSTGQTPVATGPSSATWQTPAEPSAHVDSVFGRTGTVTANTGDYTPAQVGAVPTAYLPSTGTAGAPTAGAWVVGQQAVDSTNRTWDCTASGTPGTWALSGTFVPAQSAAATPNKIGTPSYVTLPNNWFAGPWFRQKALAPAGTGIAALSIIGDSIAAGENPSNADALIYGWAGRLRAALTPVLGAAWEAFPVNPYLSGQVSAPSSPLTWTGTSTPFYDGGLAGCTGFPDASAWEMTVAANAHPVTGALPTSVEFLYVDASYAGSQSFQYQIDSAAAVSAPTLSGSGSNYTSSTLKRLTVALDGLSTHTVKFGQCTAGYTVLAASYVIHYGTSGLGLGRNGYPGFKAVDFAEGAGATAGGSTTSAPEGSYGPDHIQPWTGIASSTNTAGAGAPFAPHLGIIALGVNDAGYGTHPVAFERTIARMVQAFRAGQPSPAAANVIIMAMSDVGVYGTSAGNYKSYRYKGILEGVAARYGCAFVDIDTLFGQNAIANGWMAAANVHPTANGSGTGGGDGHQLIFQTLEGIL
jgi:hypothetical protein